MKGVAKGGELQLQAASHNDSSCSMSQRTHGTGKNGHEGHATKVSQRNEKSNATTFTLNE